MNWNDLAALPEVEDAPEYEILPLAPVDEKAAVLDTLVNYWENVLHINNKETPLLPPDHSKPERMILHSNGPQKYIRAYLLKPRDVNAGRRENRGDIAEARGVVVTIAETGQVVKIIPTGGYVAEARALPGHIHTLDEEVSTASFEVMTDSGVKMIHISHGGLVRDSVTKRYRSQQTVVLASVDNPESHLFDLLLLTKPLSLYVNDEGQETEVPAEDVEHIQATPVYYPEKGEVDLVATLTEQSLLNDLGWGTLFLDLPEEHGRPMRERTPFTKTAFEQFTQPRLAKLLSELTEVRNPESKNLPNKRTRALPDYVVANAKEAMQLSLQPEVEGTTVRVSLLGDFINSSTYTQLDVAFSGKSGIVGETLKEALRGGFDLRTLFPAEAHTSEVTHFFHLVDERTITNSILRDTNRVKPALIYAYSRTVPREPLTLIYGDLGEQYTSDQFDGERLKASFLESLGVRELNYGAYADWSGVMYVPEAFQLPLGNLLRSGLENAPVTSPAITSVMSADDFSLTYECSPEYTDTRLYPSESAVVTVGDKAIKIIPPGQKWRGLIRGGEPYWEMVWFKLAARYIVKAPETAAEASFFPAQPPQLSYELFINLVEQLRQGPTTRLPHYDAKVKMTEEEVDVNFFQLITAFYMLLFTNSQQYQLMKQYGSFQGIVDFFTKPFEEFRTDLNINLQKKSKGLYSQGTTIYRSEDKSANARALLIERGLAYFKGKRAIAEVEELIPFMRSMSPGRRSGSQPKRPDNQTAFNKLYAGYFSYEQRGKGASVGAFY